MRRTQHPILGILTIAIILTPAIVTLTEFETISAQAQVNASTLTPEQKAAICNPNDTHINMTESKICGKPVTPSTSSSAANTTTASSTNNTNSNNTSSSILPSIVP